MEFQTHTAVELSIAGLQFFPVTVCIELTTGQKVTLNFKRKKLKSLQKTG